MFFVLSNSILVGIYLEVVCEHCEIDLHIFHRNSNHRHLTILLICSTSEVDKVSLLKCSQQVEWTNVSNFFKSIFNLNTEQETVGFTAMKYFFCLVTCLTIGDWQTSANEMWKLENKLLIRTNNHLAICHWYVE